MYSANKAFYKQIIRKSVFLCILSVTLYKVDIMETYKNRVSAALAMIAEKQLNPTDVERICGVNRTQIYRWKSGEVKQMRYSTFNKLAKHLGYDISHNKNQIITTPHKKNNKDTQMSIQAYEYCIELQKKEITRLEDVIKQIKVETKHSKPAFHFKMISRYVAKTDAWLDTDIFGDFSMTGYTYDEIVTLVNEENDKGSWIDRYHPDSRKRLNNKTLKDVRTDYHHLTWNHMMWMAKDGTYKCYNIDLMYDRKKEQATSMFYWVNGDTE